MQRCCKSQLQRRQDRRGVRLRVRWQGITRLEISYQADTDAKRGTRNRCGRFALMQRTRASSKATLPVNPTVPTRHLRALHALVAAKNGHIHTFYRRGNAPRVVSCCLLRDRAMTAMCIKL